MALLVRLGVQGERHTPIFHRRDFFGNLDTTGVIPIILVADNLYLHEIAAHTRVTAQDTRLQLELT